MNTLIAWSALPIGFGLVAPNAASLLDPLLGSHGALASTVGAVIGTGPGRGIGFMYLLFGAAILAVGLTAMRVPVLARFDRDVPDAIADDLVGLQALRDASPGAPLTSVPSLSPSVPTRTTKTEAMT